MSQTEKNKASEKEKRTNVCIWWQRILWGKRCVTGKSPNLKLHGIIQWTDSKDRMSVFCCCHWTPHQNMAHWRLLLYPDWKRYATVWPPARRFLLKDAAIRNIGESWKWFFCTPWNYTDPRDLRNVWLSALFLWPKGNNNNKKKKRKSSTAVHRKLSVQGQDVARK